MSTIVKEYGLLRRAFVSSGRTLAHAFEICRIIDAKCEETKKENVMERGEGSMRDPRRTISEAVGCTTTSVGIGYALNTREAP